MMSQTADDEFSIVIGDYSIPLVTELSPDSILLRSQYAKVIFHDIADTYLTDADICCRYSLTNGVTAEEGDKIALYHVGWSSVQDFIMFEWAPIPQTSDKSELQVLFKASSLPKNVDEFYQLCYVKSDNTVCGASVPFQFRHPYENELCAVEEPGGLVVVRSRTALTEEKLRHTVAINEQLLREKATLEKNVAELKEDFDKVSAELQNVLQNFSKMETEKQMLEKRLEENLHVERHVQRLKQDLLALDAEKNQSLAKLNKAEQHITVLSATVDTLSADKEHMAQLLRSETQNKSGVVAEVSQYKSQVDSLSHMLEALTQSKELVAQELRIQQATSTQLKEDIRRLEIETREQQNKITELEQEKKLLQDLLEQALNNDKSGQEKDKIINELEKEREQLLSQLVQSASKKQEELREKTKMYEEELRGARSQIVLLEKQLDKSIVKLEEKKKDLEEAEQMNKCLVQRLKDCQKLITHNEQLLADANREKAAQEQENSAIFEAHRNALKHNEQLSQRLLELEKETAPLRLQIQESSVSLERQEHFRKVFTDLEDRIANLELDQEDTASHRRLQLDRVNAINERIAELEVEVEKLVCERRDVAGILNEKESKLSETIARLSAVDSWNFHAEALKDEVNLLTLFVESSKMRIEDIDKQLKELEQESTVLAQQQNQALERKNSWERRETDIRQELAVLHGREREIVKVHGGLLATVEDQLNQALSQNSEMLACGLSREEELALAKKEKAELERKLEKNGCSQEQECSGVNSSDVNKYLKMGEDLQLRLQMAADEYKKLYIEKQKVEKRLAKLYHKIQEKSKTLTPQQTDQLVTAELISLSQSSESDSRTDVVTSQAKGVTTGSRICPICSVSFPPGAADLFRQHFDAHLS